MREGRFVPNQCISIEYCGYSCASGARSLIYVSGIFIFFSLVEAKSADDCL